MLLNGKIFARILFYLLLTGIAQSTGNGIGACSDSFGDIQGDHFGGFIKTETV